MDFIVMHAAEIASILLAISELLGLGGKGGILALVLDVLKKIKGDSAK